MAATHQPLLDHFDFIVCPVINVDGYDDTWNGDCMVVQDFHWAEVGSSPAACSDSC
jgi:murein tripeptide amidase MpaA